MAAFLLALLLAAPPTTWADLQKDLPKDAPHRALAFLRFAKDDQAALQERIRAAREARDAFPAGAARVDAMVLEAQLQGVAGASGKRRGALSSALAAAQRAHLDGKAEHLHEALQGDAALAKLTTALTSAAKPTAKDPTKDAANAVEAALPAWLSLGDERQHGAARIALARSQALAGDVEGAVRALSDAVDALGTARDTAAVRTDGWRALAGILEAAGRMDEAVGAALAADRTALVDVSVAGMPSSSAPSLYTRSKDTAALCARAKDKKVDCAKLEEQRWSARTFYDFSKERNGAFDAARANAALTEYESLLHVCLQKGAKANLTTNTHLELVWSIGNDGHVLPAYDLRPTRLKGSVVETCLADAFAMFRYPPYRGEMQHVTLTFDVGE